MSLPLLVLPPALATADASPAGFGESSQGAEREHSVLAEVKRVVRDHGLPRLDPVLTPGRAAAWVRLIVADQIAYHVSNHRRLEAAEKSLRYAAHAFFVAAMLAVLWHFCSRAEWLLLFTAAGPAFGAGLHAAGTRLGIVHRAGLSRDVEQQLTPIDGSLARLMEADPPAKDGWPEVRRLTYEAAKMMGSENTSWHSLVRRYRDDLP